jgi:uncharacterized protein YaeQ
MLGLATTLRLDLAIDHAPPGPAGVRERVVLEKRAGESFDHVLLKLLGLALHHRPGLAIEASAGQKYKPDLLLADPDGTVRLWIDCGHVGPPKLAEVLRRNRSADVVVLKATEREARLFARAARRLDRTDRLRLEAFRDGFLAELGALVEDRARLHGEVGGGSIRVSALGRAVESPVVVVPVPGPPT